MKAVIRRLAPLEVRSLPKVDRRIQELSAVLQERRRRRLQASGLFVEEEVHHEAPVASGRCLSLAETLWFRRSRRSAFLIRTLPRRLERLETRAAVLRKDNSFSVRIHFVDPEKGLAGVLILESGKPTMIVPAAPGRRSISPRIVNAPPGAIGESFRYCHLTGRTRRVPRCKCVGAATDQFWAIIPHSCAQRFTANADLAVSCVQQQ
jgi:hypothetical protein